MAQSVYQRVAGVYSHGRPVYQFPDLRQLLFADWGVSDGWPVLAAEYDKPDQLDKLRGRGPVSLKLLWLLS